jgi:hypothetical protein
MEKKEIKTRLRLVTTDETIVNDSPIEAQPTPKPRSKFAQEMNSFADDLDRMIDLIMRS